ncbi:MAG: hypothetical protein NZM11_02265 [Anaerolineales bacterium]|nr:hypothetical protein [Anaerolineales bacterium]
MKNGMVLALAVLLLTGPACRLSVGGPTPPASPISVSTESVGELQDNLLRAAINVPASGEVGLTVTEQQLTSIVALRLQEQQSLPIRDPQVFLRDGKIQLFGVAEASGLRANALIVISASLTPEGGVVFKVEEANFGPIPVPEDLLEQASATINEAFTNSLGSTATNLRITGITIQDGRLSLTGRLTR